MAWRPSRSSLGCGDAATLAVRVGRPRQTTLPGLEREDIDPVEIAWAAGLFEGEGCWRAKGSYPCAQLKTADLDVLQRFVRIVGVGRIRDDRWHLKPGHEHFKPLYRWEVGGTARVRYLAEILGPYLGERRRRRIAEILESTSNCR